MASLGRNFHEIAAGGLSIGAFTKIDAHLRKLRERPVQLATIITCGILAKPIDNLERTHEFKGSSLGRRGDCRACGLSAGLGADSGRERLWRKLDGNSGSEPRRTRGSRYDQWGPFRPHAIAPAGFDLRDAADAQSRAPCHSRGRASPQNGTPEGRYGQSAEPTGTCPLWGRGLDAAARCAAQPVRGEQHGIARSEPGRTGSDAL